MPFSSGTFSLASGNPVTTGTTISSTWANNTLSDIASGLSTAILKDGTQTVTANIPMSSHKFTGLSTGSSQTDSANIGNVQNSTGQQLTAIAGTNTITAAGSPTLTAYASGQIFSFVAAGANTGATTLNIDSLGAKNVYWNNAACTGGEIASGATVRVMYDGTQFQLLVNYAVATLPFSDANNIIKNSSDATKLMKFSLSGLTTATTRTYTMVDGNVTLGIAGLPRGRLTLTTGTPVTTSDVTAATTHYYALYNGNTVPIYNGSAFVETTFTELSQATSDATKSPAAVAASKVYDVFVWNDSGTIRATRGPAWSSDTARGTGAGTSELQQLNGIWVNKNAITNGPGATLGTYVGSLRSDGSSQLNDTLANRAVFNAYNAADRALRRVETTSTWTYTTAAYRQANGSSSNQCSILDGLGYTGATMTVSGSVNNTTGSIDVAVGIGIDSTTTNSGAHGRTNGGTSSTQTPACVSTWAGYPGLGYHFIAWLEYSQASGTSTWQGTNAPGNSGMAGMWRA